ncbi:MAG: hypothetical protein A2937_03650 [Candidatus Yonathbacteria bacterium RIFCSPLOWO2_01_FULL_47_33b]|uniref:HNH endonuclease n=1 Tax=Candidatus Yonathbacteria bacterium RIFCSPLOWO2_01_FULL_47_33b TaxID=1802727 RepID=A0A1G2SG59_9BACT|nr:MAG: hypothetical protein A2937_03650 [Candidatus Yonathbacteria bacterium RIFCSPLOWO2_01_FULL_47_33b]
MKTSRWFFVLWMCFVTTVSFARNLPDPVRTPGVTNPDVTQENIKQTICVSGWTKTIRPPSSYTTDLKKKQIKEYRYRDKSLASYEEDHLISLQLGGHPTDPQNLWPEPYNTRCGARIKDVVETRLKRMVCAEKISLADAQKAIATNWIAAYKTYVNGEGCPALESEQ